MKYNAAGNVINETILTKEYYFQITQCKVITSSVMSELVDV